MSPMQGIGEGFFQFLFGAMIVALVVLVYFVLMLSTRRSGSAKKQSSVAGSPQREPNSPKPDAAPELDRSDID